MHHCRSTGNSADVFLPPSAYDRIRPVIARPRVIAFDWGGTLVHTHREHDAFTPGAAGVVAVLRSTGVPVPQRSADNLPAHFLETWSRSGAAGNEREFDSAEFLRGWADREGIPLPADLGPVIDAMWTPWVGCLKPIDDVRGTLSQLAAAGINLGLVSNCAVVPHICTQELARQGIGHLLNFTVFSSELGVRKPHPRLYQAAFDRAARVDDGRAATPLIPADILFVGDTPQADVDGPARAGMRTALVRTGNWTGETADLKHAPDLILDSIHQLPTLWL